MKRILGTILALFLLCGSAFAAHSVVLSCTLPSDWGANSGINWFRGTAAGAESATPMNPTPLTPTSSATCTYTDANVVAGQTLFYVATQVVGTTSSVKSNEVSGTVLPYAPVLLPPTVN